MEQATIEKTGSTSPDFSPLDPLKTAWENVVLKGLPPGQEIREEVLRSWIRCKEIGIDPFSENPPPALSSSKLRSLTRRYRELIEVSRPVIEMIQLSVKETGFIITLTEKHGHVLVVSGDSDVLEMAERNFYQPGCLRTIEVAGTNAIGLCLIEGKPIQLTGAEHYKVRHHPWTCSSAPIYDANSQLIGVITLSGRSTGQHRHTLALVTEAADAIGSQLRERALIEEKNQLNSMLTSIFNSISDGVIALNNNLCITHMNSAASEMLGLEGNALGSRLEKVVHPEAKLVQAIKKKNDLSGAEISFDCPSGQRTYICRVDPIRNSSPNEIGAILTLAEKRHMINIAKRIGGNYAKYEFRDIKGKSRRLLGQIKLAKIAAKTNSRVLIIGESGTGKELFAQAIHCYSARRNEPFVAISCATIPRDLIESELFGYKEGAFTGARRGGMVGKFELANKGTLFLDEIDGLPLELQSKLLRVLQQNEIMRLGDTQTIPVDVRVIAASNKDLLTEVEKANFREDLYYRLNVVEIHIPPLRERIEDLELLMDHILERQCHLMKIKKPRVSGEVLDILRNYSWPGNVRELENCVERALLLSQGNTIRKAHLPARLFKKPHADLLETISLQKGLQEMILSTLERCDWNVSQAARELRISRSTLYRKLRQYKVITRRR